MLALSEIFDIRYGHSLELNRLTEASPQCGFAFVSRTAQNNGISSFVERVDELQPGLPGEITVALGGSVLSTFLQERHFYTGYHVAILSPILPMTRAEKLYYCAAIAENRYRYSYGRQANRTLSSIRVPSPEDIPPFVNDDLISSMDGADKAASQKTSPALCSESWQSFRLGEIFDIRKGRRLTKAKMTEGATPYIGASDRNNGVTAWIGQGPIHSGGTITVAYNGSVAEAFYQPIDFWASDDINVLYPNFEMTPEAALFIAGIIRQEKYRFNYGRKWHLERMREARISLPATPEGAPDVDAMSALIQSLPFSSAIALTGEMETSTETPSIATREETVSWFRNAAGALLQGNNLALDSPCAMLREDVEYAADLFRARFVEEFKKFPDRVLSKLPFDQDEAHNRAVLEDHVAELEKLIEVATESIKDHLSFSGSLKESPPQKMPTKEHALPL